MGAQAYRCEQLRARRAFAAGVRLAWYRSTRQVFDRRQVDNHELAPPIAYRSAARRMIQVVKVRTAMPNIRTSVALPAYTNALCRA